MWFFEVDGPVDGTMDGNMSGTVEIWALPVETELPATGKRAVWRERERGVLTWDWTEQKKIDCLTDCKLNLALPAKGGGAEGEGGLFRHTRKPALMVELSQWESRQTR